MIMTDTQDLSQLSSKIDELQKRYQKALKRQTEVKALLEEKKKELTALFKEIQAEGYDPKSLSTELAKLMEDLRERVKTFETDLAQVEKALDKYDTAAKSAG